MLKKLRGRAGSSYVSVCVGLLVICAIFSAVLFYARTISTVREAREDVRAALDSFVMRNSVEIYGYIKQGSDHTESLDGETFVSEVASQMSLSREGGLLRARDSGGNTVFLMSEPEVSFVRDGTLRLEARYEMSVPVYFAGRRIYSFSFPVSVTGGLESRY